MNKIHTTKPPRVFLDASVSEFGVVGIGIFESQSKEKASITVQTTTTMSSTEAEELAFRKAIVFAMSKFSSKTLNFFTDNQSVYKNNRDLLSVFNKKGYQLTINWIPRELNTEADKLSKLASSRGSVTGCNTVEKAIEENVSGTIITGIAGFIREKTLVEKMNLMRRVFINKIEVDAISYFFDGKGTKPKVTKTNKVFYKDFAKYISCTFFAQEKKKYKDLKNFLEHFKEGPGNQVPGLKDKHFERLIRSRVKQTLKD